MVTSRFLDDLVLRDLDDAQWEVVREFRYDSAIFGGRILVPVGFRTNLASIPRYVPLAFALLGDTGRKAAVVHDFLYTVHMSDRETADQVFAEALDVLHYSAIRRWIMYQALRVFGGRAWSTDQVRRLFFKKEARP